MLAPSSYSFLAIARPIPRLAPVIMATLFMDIEGKVALITGSAKRIGREIALELARRGARIAVHYRSSASEAKEVAGDTGAIYQAELTNTDAIEKMFRAVEQKFGRLDILVNSASMFSPATADDATPEHWDWQMATNAKAPFFAAQHAARLMRKAGAGKIINIADVAGGRGCSCLLPSPPPKTPFVSLHSGL